MAKKEESYWEPGFDKRASEEGQRIKNDPSSMIPTLPQWGQPKPETRDMIISALMGLKDSIKGAQESAQFGDPLLSALSGIAGAAGQPGAQAIANKRAMDEQAMRMAQLEATPVEMVSPGIVAKHPELKGVPLALIQKIAPILSRQDALEQQFALFLAAEKGRNERSGQAAATRDEKSTRTEERQLRNELKAQSKDFITIRDNFSRINQVSKNPTPAGDLSLIFSYMKLLDPGSTVRESEFKNAELAAPLVQRMGLDFNKVESVWAGKKLTDSQRADFIAKAKEIYGSQKNLNDVSRAEYRRLAEAAGGKAENVDVIAGPDLAEQETADSIKAMFKAGQITRSEAKRRIAALGGLP